MTRLRIDGLRRAAAILAVGLVAVAGSAQQPALWKPGQFKELLTGKAKRKDVTRLLGETKRAKSGKLETYTYPDKGELGGKLLVDVDAASGIVESIIEQFSPNLTRTQAYKKFGKDYREVHYSVSTCPQVGSTPMVYRDPKGGMELLEYPQKGIILWPNQYGFDIAAVVYRAHPLPMKKPICSKK